MNRIESILPRRRRMSIPGPNLYLGLVMGVAAFSPSKGASEPATPPTEASHAPKVMVLLKDDLSLRARPDWASAASKTGTNAGARVEAIERRLGPGVETEPAHWTRIRADKAVGWIPDAWLAPQPQTFSAKTLRQIGAEPVDRYHGIDPDYIPPDLTSISRGYDDDIEYRLRDEAAQAYERMVAAARGDGVSLYVVSAYRNYGTQRRIYMRKLKSSGWQQSTVAKPGHSEHQLGTTIDMTDGEPESLLQASFGETRAGRWLRRRAPEFGFAISYTEANAFSTGYSPEPWHYRFYGKNAAQAIHRAALAGPGSQ